MAINKVLFNPWHLCVTSQHVYQYGIFDAITRRKINYLYCQPRKWYIVGKINSARHKFLRICARYSFLKKSDKIHDLHFYFYLFLYEPFIIDAHFSACVCVVAISIHGLCYKICFCVVPLSKYMFTKIYILAPSHTKFLLCIHFF